MDDKPDFVVRIPSVVEWINANNRRRTHWSKDRALTAAWRERAGWCAKQARIPALGLTRVVAELHMVPRRRVRIDPANYAPTAKAAVDGLVDAGIWPDDSSGWVVGPDMRLGPPVKLIELEALVLHLFGQPCCELAECHHRTEAA